MGTRAVYFFEERLNDDCYYGVYKHYDGYPQGAAAHIEDAKAYAWPLPRWEADEFAAAFVAANKNPKGGEVRLLPNFEHTSIPMMMEENTCCDYYYIISWDDYDREMFVTIFESRYDEKLETQYWHETASMRHSEMLRAYPVPYSAEAS